LLDDPYYEAMLRVGDALADSELAFCLVGGGAAQVWIASMRTGSGERRISEESVLQTALRKTRDLDFATRADSATMLQILNQLAASSGHGAHVLGPRALRLGPVAVSFTLEPADLSGMANLYDQFLASRRLVQLRRGSQPDAVPTIGLPELLATKLTRRGDKAKDLVDVTQLIAAADDAGQTLDLDAVRTLVSDREDALGLLDAMIGRTLEQQ
jgi:hypothetical protein